MNQYNILVHGITASSRAKNMRGSLNKQEYVSICVPMNASQANRARSCRSVFDNIIWKLKKFLLWMGTACTQRSAQGKVFHIICHIAYMHAMHQSVYCSSIIIICMAWMTAAQRQGVKICILTTLIPWHSPFEVPLPLRMRMGIYSYMRCARIDIV